MNERPIIFSSPMVRAILEDRKWQTRRVLRVQPHEDLRHTVHYDRATGGAMWASIRGDHGIACPFGKPGDRLWVRETFAGERAHGFIYLADGEQRGEDALGWRWRPAIHMPRWACRLVLEVTGVRVERLQNITRNDAMAEGIDEDDYGPPPSDDLDFDYVAAYRQLWDALNAKRGHGWAANPWVWVVEFKRA